jgi:dipeptidyl aminopeptidase/acylaminoacyl peptidase
MLKILTKWLAAARVQRSSYQSAGRTIRCDILLPRRRQSPVPAVILLHGSNGAADSETQFHLLMQGLARLGYATLFPRFFESTGHEDLGDSAARDAAVEQSFLTWQQAVSDAVDAAARVPGVDKNRIALAGISLGSFLALGAAANHGRVRCVVEVCGGLPENLRGRVETMPPVLILHGADDPIVSVERAYELQRELTAKNLPHELCVYPGEGHIFKRGAEADALQRTRAFLAQHLLSGDTI